MAKVFFSWQADTERKTGKNLVHRALESAVEALNDDDEVEDAERPEDDSELIAKVELDMDTKSVPGSPAIVDTILAKIDSAGVFVADVTFVGLRRDGRRPMPNPNVMIEYGWAIRALRYERVVTVINTAYGEPDEQSMPFDMRHLRWPITYNCPEGADDATRTAARRQLAKELKEALKPILAISRTPRAPRPPFVPRPTTPGDEARFRAAGEPIGNLHSGSLLPEPAMPVFADDGAAMWLRVFPEFARDEPISILTLRQAIAESGHLVRPLNVGESDINFHRFRGADGYGLGVVVDNKALLVLYAFDTGEVWTLDTHLLSAATSRVFFNTDHYCRALIDIGALLQRLGIQGPYRWIAGLRGIKGRHLQPPNRQPAFLPPEYLKDMIVCEGTYSGDPDEASGALSRFFTAVYDAAGLAPPSTSI